MWKRRPGEASVKNKERKDRSLESGETKGEEELDNLAMLLATEGSIKANERGKR